MNKDLPHLMPDLDRMTYEIIEQSDWICDKDIMTALIERGYRFPHAGLKSPGSNVYWRYYHVIERAKRNNPYYTPGIKGRTQVWHYRIRPIPLDASEEPPLDERGNGRFDRTARAKVPVAVKAQTTVARGSANALRSRVESSLANLSTAIELVTGEFSALRRILEDDAS